jgi:uncharacterized protein YecT (DUF1311 family)
MRGLGWGLLLALLTAAPFSAQAADRFAYQFKETPEEGPIDPAVQKHYTAAWTACQARGVTTLDYEACFEAEFARQDAKLNRVWKATLGRLPADVHGPLVEAQRKWIAARNPFCTKVSDGFKGGTIEPIVYEDCRVEQTIRRTMWLEALR